MHPREIRASFLKYFERHGHRVVPSSPLLPGDDPTLLFTNAGMNQFKDVFLGREKRDYTRAASSQKCMRVSGKHNDLDNVGPSLRHHTFFEMLGNFSFGDYFKHDAIELAWNLLTEGVGARSVDARTSPSSRASKAFRATTRRTSGGCDFVPADHIGELGMADNFWAMGDTGPCGRCSEIYVDRGAGVAGTGNFITDVESGSERFVEIWNNVFMEFERDAKGTLHALPAPSIDTGMGLERISAVMQGTLSNYDTPLFMPLLEAIGKLSGHTYGGSMVADRRLDARRRRSRARVDVPDRRRRRAVERVARLRAAQDHAARDAPRPQARAARAVPVLARRRARARDGRRLSRAEGRTRRRSCR